MKVFQKYMDNDIRKGKDFLENWVLWKVLVNNFDSYIQMADFFFWYFFIVWYSNTVRYKKRIRVCVCVCVKSESLDFWVWKALQNLHHSDCSVLVAWISHEMCDLALRMITVIHTYLNSCWCSVLNSVRCQDSEFVLIHNIVPFLVERLAVIRDYQ